MAWADLLTRTTGDWITNADWALIKAALQERTGWIGDSTEHTKADALDFAVGSFIDADTNGVSNAQDIVENIAGNFVDATMPASGSQFPRWSFKDLCQHMYDNHGGEASGMYYQSSPSEVYGWIRVPSRVDTRTLGQVESGDWICYEHLRGLAFALDHLRWLHFALDTTPYSSKFRWADKGVGYIYDTTAAAWAAMKADTPSITPYASPTVSGNIDFNGSKYLATESRILAMFKAYYSFLSGHTPTEWADGKILVKLTTLNSWKGPMVLLADVTDTAAGAYSSGDPFIDSFSIANSNVLEMFDLDYPDNYPKSDTTKYLCLYSGYYDETDPGAIGFNQLQMDWPGFDMTLKPTTSYGT
jgi:hypothetical protein